MFLKKIILENYRNYTRQSVEFKSNINLFIGKNAQGKTNLLEAIYYSSTGTTFRHNKDIELINWNNNFFKIKCELIKKDLNRELYIELYYDRQGNKQIKINGVKYRKTSDLFGFLQTVTFSPDDLGIIKDGPAERRKYIDIEICQLVGGYYNILINYNKILKQRNALLKEIKRKNQNPDSLDVWDEQLIKYGSLIIKNRLDFLKKVVPLARKNHNEITYGKEQINIKYSSSIISKQGLDIEEITKQFREIIEKNRREDIFKNMTLFGPHRDDLIFYLNDKNLKIYGSQGQQRTAILALKLAELNLFNSQNGEYPILLFDDVMSELDDNRRDFLIKVIKENQIQTFITGANMELVDSIKQKIEVFRVESGVINGSRGK
ncbi:MAG: hypothetical protein VR72_16340 [Clostridiaceae bacterium BRH_c20a]|nr:MAG: hypothetical protein VR72_16340 [Clostridiaceae bacterium BRH_c20a]